MGTIQISDDERTLAQKAYEQFDTYAGVKKEDDLSEMPRLQQLQIQHHRWQARALAENADTSLSTMTLGVVEEACWELIEAVEQGNEEEQVDTIGDILVYTCAACTLLRLDFGTLARQFDPTLIELPENSEGLLRLVKAIGQLAHVVGKTQQKTRGYDEIAKVREHGGAVISRICAAVHWLAFANDWEVSVLFESVLLRVMQRDWTKNKITGDVDGAQAALPLAGS